MAADALDARARRALNHTNAEDLMAYERLRSALDGIAGWAIDFNDAKARAERALVPNGQQLPAKELEP